MKSNISATHAARSFSDLLNRVHYCHEEFIIERSGEPVCHMMPVSLSRCTVPDFVALLRQAPPPDAEYLQVIEDLTTQQAPLPPAVWPC